MKTPTRNRGTLRRDPTVRRPLPQPRLHLNTRIGKAVGGGGAESLPVSQGLLQPREERAVSVICFNNPAEQGEN